VCVQPVVESLRQFRCHPNDQPETPGYVPARCLTSDSANLANWEERASVHAALPEYEVDRFRADPAFLSEVVQFDLPRLGDLTGLRGGHLQ
jgi:hypothetical protein